MGEKFSFPSKIFITVEKKVVIFKVILNICLACISITTLIKIITSGFNFGLVAELVLAFLIVSLYNKRPQSNNRYEECTVELLIGKNETEVLYLFERPSNINEQKYVFRNVQVEQIEYSTILNCVHIIGRIYCKEEKKEKEINELFIYIENQDTEKILAKLSDSVGKKIKNMDAMNEP